MEIQYPDELLQSYFSLPIPECMIEFIIQKASSVIKCSPHPGNQSIQIMPSLPDFIRQLLLRVKVQSTVLVGAAVYLDRLRQKLPPGAKGMYCTTHRIFLASLIVASKYLCDTSLKNKHWAKYSSLSVQEINLMERQLLGLLEFELVITESNIRNILNEHWKEGRTIGALPNYTPLTPTSPAIGSPVSHTSSTSPIPIQRSQQMLTPEPSPPFFHTPIFGTASTNSNHLQLQCECFRQVPSNITSSYTVPVLKIEDTNSVEPKRAEEYVDINLTSLDEAIKKEVSITSESLISAAPTLSHEAPKHKAHVIHIHKHYPHPQYSQSTVAPNRLLQPYPPQQFTRPTFRPRTTSDASEASLSSSASSATLCLQEEFILNKVDDKIQHYMDDSFTRRNSINSLNSSLNPETLASSARTLPMEHTFHSEKEKLQFLGSANIMTHTLTGSNSENSLLQMPSLSLKEAHYQESGFSMS